MPEHQKKEIQNFFETYKLLEPGKFVKITGWGNKDEALKIIEKSVEKYKAEFIEFLLDTNVLKIGGPFKLKSGRMAPYFLNVGDISDGDSLNKLGKYYAEAIIKDIGTENFDTIIEIPYKAIHAGAATAINLAEMGYNKGVCFYRKEKKDYGEASVGGNEKVQKEMLVGKLLPKGSRTILLDDVFTAGDAKYEAESVIRNITEDVELKGLIIAANRQEINEYGGNAIDEFYKDKGIMTASIVSVSDIIYYLKENNKLSASDENLFMNYLKAWGTKEAREKYGLKNKPLIEGRTVIPACDIDSIEKFKEIIEATKDNKKIGGYKIGFELGLSYSLQQIVDIAKNAAPDKKIIYDHQKAGTDIPDTGRNFAKVCKKAGVDAVIFFPQSGPVTQTAWTGEALQAGLDVIIGGEMTHKGYKKSDGGYIDDYALAEMCLRGARHGITNFVVPGNKPEMIEIYRKMLEGEGIEPVFYSPGFVAQGGRIEAAVQIAGDRYHPIVGRGIYTVSDMNQAARSYIKMLQ